MQRTLRIYAAGGAGTNVTSKRIEPHASKAADGFAKLDIAYIDTSRSNLDPSIDDARVYLIEGVDGSGQVRTENKEEIELHTREILQQFKPGDANIVIHSASGGSGSVIGPYLIRELLTRGLSAIVVAIGDDATTLYANNTIKTLKTYAGIAKVVGQPVAMHYLHNAPDRSRSQINEDVEGIVVALAALFSGQNHGLDTSDLSNFLRYQNVTSFKPDLVHLETLDADNSRLTQIGNAITVATLCVDMDHDQFPGTTDYQCTGILPNNVTMAGRPQLPCHFVTCDGVIPKVVTMLSKSLREAEEAKNARVIKDRILDANDQIDSNGLVF